MAKSKKVSKRAKNTSFARQLKQKAIKIFNNITDNENKVKLDEIYEALFMLNFILDDIYSLTFTHESFIPYYSEVRHFIFVLEKIREERIRFYGTNR